MRKLKLVTKAIAWLFFYWGATIFIGAILGALAAPIIAWAAGTQVTFPAILIKGASLGGRWAGVWAGGLAIVLVCKKGYTEHWFKR